MRPFEDPALSLGDLDAQTAARLIAASSDVALVIDETGVIRDLAFGSEELSSGDYRDWLGKPWAETVTVESRPKIAEMLRDAGARTATRWRHINHPTPGGADLPLLYAAVPVGRQGHALAVGRAVAFGRDLRVNAQLQQRLVAAQQAMERDYWRMRHMETRYRVLFQLASEPVLVLDAATFALEEVNPAAARLLGGAPARGSTGYFEGFEPEGAAALRDLLTALRAGGRAETVTLRLAATGQEQLVTASLFRQDKSSHFLLRFAPAQVPALPAAPSPRELLARAVESAPDAFVVTDVDGLVLIANRAFLDLAQAVNEEQVRGLSLDRWLGRTGVDVDVLLSNLRQRGSVRLFSTHLRGEFGSTAEVEVSAVSVPDADPPCLGLAIRDVGRRLSGDARASREVPRSVGQMTELVGRMSLKEIVRDTTDLIEQLCIEAALQLTRDNRASAAEMLGLSRQSLYVKLRRYGMGESVPDADD